MMMRGVANLVLAVAVLVLTSVLLDQVFRLYEARWLAPRAAEHDGVVDLGALNYNDTVVPIAKSDGESRILSIGDSFAYSVMSYPYSYAGVCASVLNEGGDGPIRVINVGEPSTTVTDYMAAYEYWAPVVHADAAVFMVYLGNDVLDVAFGYTDKRWEPNRIFGAKDIEIGSGRRRPSFIPHLWPLRMMDYAYAYYLSHAVLPPSSELRPDARYNIAATELPAATYREVNEVQMVDFRWAERERLALGYQAIAEFIRFVAALRKTGTNVLVALAPSEAQVDATLWRDLGGAGDYDRTLPNRIIEEIRDQIAPDVAILDLTPYFRCEARRGVPLYFPRNTHWNLEGNALAGKVLGSYILEEWFGRPVQKPRPADGCRDVDEPVRDDAIAAWVSEKLASWPSGRDSSLGVVRQEGSRGERTSYPSTFPR